MIVELVGQAKAVYEEGRLMEDADDVFFTDIWETLEKIRGDELPASFNDSGEGYIYQYVRDSSLIAANGDHPEAWGVKFSKQGGYVVLVGEMVSVGKCRYHIIKYICQ